ncbi:alpha/beta hydrolase fold domain-containing protein [Actinomadura sp. J1-007]|nr:alpha/beta hydrolase fold domain-containing protein [Actinomadura sp. J1-007]
MAAGFPPLGPDTDAADVRRALESNPIPDIEPLPVGRVEDRTIPGPGGPLPIRLYWPQTPPTDGTTARPPGATSDQTAERLQGAPTNGMTARSPGAASDSGEAAQRLPVVVFFHGGGFVLCGLDSHDRLCRALTAGSGAIVMAVDYRLAPEHPFPAAVEDARAAVAWASRNAAALGGDPARLAVAGDSAGGALAASACLHARDRGGPHVAFQLLIYPVTDAAQDTASYRDHAEGGFLTAAHMRWFWEQYLSDPAQAADPDASPLRADDLSGLPPACVLTAECDPLRDEGEAYAARLAEAGVPVQSRRFEGAFHGFASLDHVLPVAGEAQRIAAEALRNALR